ncbi:LPS biosynthesis protein [Pectobacterium carotovorum subsp. carotovorum]|nr:LPS biosynthesis protein [Pectobacterium carotovorum subsp. carotovorum]
MALLGQAQNLIAMLNGIVNAPASNAIVRYTSEHCDKGYSACAPWWRASIQWIIIFCCSLIPVGLIFSSHISEWLFENKQYAWLICLMFFTLPFSAVAALINAVINGQQQYKRFILLGIFSVIMSSIMMVTLIINWGINGALIAASIQSGLIGVFMLLASSRQPWLHVNYWWGAVTQNCRKDIGGYILMAVAAAISMPMALIMVRKIIIAQVGWDAAGQWQAVWKISEVYLSVMTIALSTYFLPRLAKLNSYRLIRNEINKAVIVIVPIVVFMAISVYLLRDVIITVLFTEKFRDARDLFFIQLIGDVIKIIGWLYACPMISRGATKWFVASEVIFSITFVIMSYVLISLYHTSGASMAYAVTYCFYFIFVFVGMKKIIREKSVIYDAS